MRAQVGWHVGEISAVWYSVVACCCVCMHMVVFGDALGEVMLGLSPHNKQY